VKTSISAPLWRPLSAEKVFVLIFNCETLSGSGVRLVIPSRELPLDAGAVYLVFGSLLPLAGADDLEGRLRIKAIRTLRS